jgi:hypothetical protein
MMKTEDALAVLSAQRWTFAKSMPHNPHEYIVRGRHVDADTFEALVTVIRTNAEARIFGRLKYLVFYPGDGYRYWTMGHPFPITKIINRAKVEFDNTRPVTDETKGLPWSGPDGEKPQLTKG